MEIIWSRGPVNKEEMQIRLKEVTKTFRLYASPNDRLVESLFPFVNRHQDFHALKDISLEVFPGETLGVVGMNGSGKSTLLKMICGVLTPTSGSISVNGRIGALLELGAGFNPELTGRQNIYFQASLLGIPHEIIQQKVKEILDFSEIEEFIDQPVKTYSSGMFVRLAFSVNVATDPEILVIDEALAVGDAYFQTKCTGKIRQMVSEGKTLVFVSHDPSAIKTLCQRAILIHQGRMMDEGTPEHVFDYYNAILAKKGDVSGSSVLESRRKEGQRSGNQKAEIISVTLLGSDGKTAESFPTGEEVHLLIRAKINEPMTDPTFGFLIRDRLGNEIFGTNNFHLEVKTGDHQLGEMVLVSYRFKLNLGTGIYSITVAVHSEDHHLQDSYDWVNQALVFQVHLGRSQKFVGTTRLEPVFEFQKQ